ncbi:MAG: hypothetical protein WBQ79_08165 [Acidobacteriaceae bacterium]
MRDRIPFSHLLPLIDLALLFVLVLVPISLTTLRLYEAAKGADRVHVHTSQLDMVLQRDQFVPWAIRVATVPKARTIMAINLPGSVIQSLISLPSGSSTPSGWHPQALALETWQALVFPFFALPFWWLVGCGLDTLVYNERLSLSLAVIGTVSFASCLVPLIVLWISAAASERSDVLVKGVAGWTIGFAILPIAWIVQSIRKRRSTPAASL